MLHFSSPIVSLVCLLFVFVVFVCLFPQSLVFGAVADDSFSKHTLNENQKQEILVIIYKKKRDGGLLYYVLPYETGMMSGGTLFEELGYYYVGPVDGHDMDNLVPILENIRDKKDDKPVSHPLFFIRTAVVIQHWWSLSCHHRLGYADEFM